MQHSVNTIECVCRWEITVNIKDSDIENLVPISSILMLFLVYSQGICQMSPCFNPLSQSLPQAGLSSFRLLKTIMIPPPSSMCRVWIIAAYRGRKWIYLFLFFMSVISDICWSHKWPYSGVWKRCAVVSPWLYSVFEPSVQKQISAPLLQEYVRQRIPSIKYWVGSLRRCAQLFGSASS